MFVLYFIRYSCIFPSVIKLVEKIIRISPIFYTFHIAIPSFHRVTNSKNWKHKEKREKKIDEKMSFVLGLVCSIPRDLLID